MQNIHYTKVGLSRLRKFLPNQNFHNLVRTNTIICLVGVEIENK